LKRFVKYNTLASFTHLQLSAAVLMSFRETSFYKKALSAFARSDEFCEKPAPLGMNQTGKNHRYRTSFKRERGKAQQDHRVC